MADYGVSGLGCKIQGLQFRSLGYGATMALKLAENGFQWVEFLCQLCVPVSNPENSPSLPKSSLPLQYKSVETTVVSDKFVLTYLVILKLP